MSLQYITDSTGKQTAVLIPIEEWQILTSKYIYLKELENRNLKTKGKLSQLAGKLSEKTANAMLNYVEEGRNEWDERVKK